MTPSSLTQSSRLPPRPNFEHLRNEAKSRLKEMRQSDPAAKLAAAQFDVARKYGFTSWRALRAHLAEEPAENVTPAGRDEEVDRLFYEQSRPRDEVAIDLALLDKYTGEYQLSPQAIFTVTRQVDQLVARLTGQAAYPLYPESETKFFYKVVRAQISFTGDDEGHASALTLHQDGRERRAPRIAHQAAEDVEKTLAQRIRQGIPATGSETALRRQIDAMMRNDGVPEYSEMTSELAEISRPQVPILAAQFSELGPLHSISFFGVGQLGWDIYRVDFENGVVISRIRLNQEGKVAGLLLQQGP